jgi:hypothetical protein
MAKDEGAKLLSGGNPQIAKGYGDTVVQSYIAAMPGWKHTSAAASTPLSPRRSPKWSRR